MASDHFQHKMAQKRRFRTVFWAQNLGACDGVDPAARWEPELPLCQLRYIVLRRGHRRHQQIAYENASCFEFFLCFLRACLGKLIVFIYKLLNKEMFFAPQ